MRLLNFAGRASKSERVKLACDRLLNASLKGLLVLLLFSTVAACGRFVGPLVEARPTARLTYPNPVRPDPVIPPMTAHQPIPWWTNQDLPAGDLLCIPSRDWVNIRVYRKEVAHWMKQAAAALDYHESMNRPLPDAPEKP
jgi:hypothetical protein